MSFCIYGVIHIYLNLIVSNGLKAIYDALTNIRNVVRFVKSSLARLNMFKNCAKSLNIEYIKIVCQDVLTK